MKRPTQVDVARLAGVSRATVSYVVNGLADGYVSITPETRERVLQAAAELGYHPDSMAQSLRMGVSNTVGVLIPDMHNPHYWQIVRGIELEVQTHDYDVLLMSTSLNPDRELHSLRSLAQRRVDGLILLLSFPEHVQEEIETLVQNRKPVVIIGRQTSHSDSVRTSYGAGGSDVMSHLLGLGHRRIGLVFGVAHPNLGADRMAAYRKGLETAGVPVDESLIQYCGTTIEEGYKAAALLLDIADPPTALVVINDLLAIGVLRAVRERGVRVPKGISVASFDDVEMAAYLNPPLTTVHVEAEEMGRTAVRLIFQRLADPALPPQAAFLPGKLMVRGSTGPVSSKRKSRKNP